jgi:hypothetical protein
LRKARTFWWRDLSKTGQIVRYKALDQQLFLLCASVATILQLLLKSGNHRARTAAPARDSRPDASRLGRAGTLQILTEEEKSFQHHDHQCQPPRNHRSTHILPMCANHISTHVYRGPALARGSAHLDLPYSYRLDFGQDRSPRVNYSTPSCAPFGARTNYTIPNIFLHDPNRQECSSSISLVAWRS